MVTRKDYKAIAEIIKQEYTRFDNTGEDDYEGHHTLLCVVAKLAHYFAANNPRFDREKFLQACYPKRG